MARERLRCYPRGPAVMGWVAPHRITIAPLTYCMRSDSDVARPFFLQRLCLRSQRLLNSGLRLEFKTKAIVCSADIFCMNFLKCFCVVCRCLHGYKTVDSSGAFISDLFCFAHLPTKLTSTSAWVWVQQHRCFAGLWVAILLSMLAIIKQDIPEPLELTFSDESIWHSEYLTST